MLVADLMRRQDGVVSRGQVLERGGNDDDIARLIRRRERARLFEGVYVEHTGPPSWCQRAWAATLLHSPAALDAGSALAAWGAAERADTIELAVCASRRVTDPAGVRTRRTRAWERVTQLNLSPPRVRLETAALIAASRSVGDDAAVALLGDLVQQRRTTATRLQAELAVLTSLPRRRLLTEVLGDVEQGAWSALERRYLRSVERAHGLPRGRRQLRVVQGKRTVLRDVAYPGQHTVVELDGRLGHVLWRDRWTDLDRDLHSVVEGSITLRVGWAQVLQPCRVADAMSAILVVRGWDGRPVRCGERCELR